MRRSTSRLAAVLVAGLLSAACSGADGPAGNAASGPEATDVPDGYGEPADATEANRTIEVTVDNELAFEPSEYEVAAGAVVTFRVTNTGEIEHEFVLGDEEAQRQMSEEMGGEGHAHEGEPLNAVTIAPGGVAELTWRFPETATTVLVGCHVPGHYEAGMRATVTVA